MYRERAEMPFVQTHSIQYTNRQEQQLRDTCLQASSGSRSAADLKAKGGVWKIGEAYRPLIGILHTQLNAYVEGDDFELTVTGEIKFKR